MKFFAIAILIFLKSFCSFGQVVSDTINKKLVIEQFKTDLIGKWYSVGFPAVLLKEKTVVDTVLQNNLPFKPKDNIEFYKNGSFKVNGSGSLRPYEVTANASFYIDWSIQIKLDGYSYDASMHDGKLSLGYNVGGLYQYVWDQGLEKKK